jgi:glycosyltransferase involved in cell wall biosynthesis
MNILYLVPHVPNPTKVRSYFHIRGLLEAGHKVTVATLRRGAGDDKHLAQLSTLGAGLLVAPLRRQAAAINSLGALLTPQLPLQAQFAWSGQLQGHITAYLHATPPDIIHVEHLRMAGYALPLLRDWPIIWDAVDFLGSLYSQAARTSASFIWRIISGLEAQRLATYEPWLVSQFLRTLVITSADKALFEAAAPAFRDRVRVASLGLPMNYVPGTQTRVPNTIALTGTLNYHPNVASTLYFVHDIFPLILQRHPETRLQIIGANPVPAIQALQSAQISVTGFVPSLFDALSQSTLAVAPILYGSGIQVKVMEAFLTATPVVSTTTALRGLAVTHGEHLLSADTPTLFAEAVVRLLEDEPLRSRLGAAGRQYVEQYHDLNRTTALLTPMYEEVIALHRSAKT